MPQGEKRANHELSIGAETLKDELNKVMCQPVTLESGKTLHFEMHDARIHQPSYISNQSN